MDKEIVYIEHYAGDFEDGLQICIHCGKVLLDYTEGVAWHSPDPNTVIKCNPSWPRGPIFITGKCPEVTMTTKPLVNYGPEDHYTRTVVKCDRQLIKS